MHTPFYKCHLFIIALSLIAAAGGLFYWLKIVHPFETTDNAYLKSHMSLISPKESGYVKEVLFEDNQKVMTGDVLVTARCSLAQEMCLAGKFPTRRAFCPPFIFLWQK